MTVTKAMLDQLRAERARPELQLDYTIGGSTETEVARGDARQRALKIAVGEHTMKEALEDFRSQQVFSSLNGLAKAHFNHKQ